MKHRSKNLLGGREKQYLNEQSPVNLGAASHEISWQSCAYNGRVRSGFPLVVVGLFREREICCSRFPSNCARSRSWPQRSGTRPFAFRSASRSMSTIVRDIPQGARPQSTLARCRAARDGRHNQLCGRSQRHAGADPILYKLLRYPARNDSKRERSR